MFKKMMNQAVIELLRKVFALRTKKYPSKLWHKTRSEFIERVKKHK